MYVGADSICGLEAAQNHRFITALVLLQQVGLSIGSSSTLFQMTFERERAMIEVRLQLTTVT